jgi:hypothetical protein
MGNSRAGLRGPDFLRRIIAFDSQPHGSVDAFEVGFPFAAGRRNSFGIGEVNGFLQAIPRERAIHGSGVDVGVAEFLCDEPRIGALSAGTGAVDGDDDGRWRLQLRFNFVPAAVSCDTHCAHFEERTAGFQLI